MRRFRTPASILTFCAGLALIAVPAGAKSPVEPGKSAAAMNAVRVVPTASAAAKSMTTQPGELVEGAAKGSGRTQDVPTLPTGLPAPAQEVVDQVQEKINDALSDVPGIGGVELPVAQEAPDQDAQQVATPVAATPTRRSRESSRGSSSVRRDRSTENFGGLRASVSPESSDRADRTRSARSASPVADLVKSSPATAATTSDIDEASPITRIIHFVPQRYRIAIVVLAMLCSLLAAVLIRERVRSRRALHEAQTDPLTGLMNRRAFDAVLAEEWARAQRYDRPLSLLFLDVDQFKKFNDSKGHLAGDDLLKELAHVLRLELRSFDIAARLGGDEFVVACPETDNSGAEQAAYRLNKVLAGLPVKVSVGWAARREADRALSELMTRADKQMYRAKALANTG